MIRFRSGVEYHLVVTGRAVSFRSKRARLYKRRVRMVGRRAFRRPLEGGRLEVSVDYFFPGKRRVDMDNVAKCVLDAMSGVVYGDDRQVILQMASGHSIEGRVHLEDIPIDMVKPLLSYCEYVFIRIFDPDRS